MSQIFHCWFIGCMYFYNGFYDFNWIIAGLIGNVLSIAFGVDYFKKYKKNTKMALQLAKKDDGVFTIKCDDKFVQNLNN